MKRAHRASYSVAGRADGLRPFLFFISATMTSARMEKEIKAWVWNPANSLFKRKKSEKAVGHIISCRCPEKCALYAKGNCVAFDNHCPYGNRSCVVGFSRMALKFNAWINNFKEIHKEAYAANITQPKKLEYFMDLVYVPIAYWNLNERIEFVDGKGVFTSSKPIIKRVHFNAQLISKEILNFKPRALFGGIITDFQQEEVPKFLIWLKQLDPVLYEEVKVLNPEHPAFTNITNVGRRAILQTLNPNVGTFTDIHGGVWTWDGEYLYSKNSHFAFALIEYRETEECRLKPNKNVIVKVSDDTQVNSNTEFID